MPDDYITTYMITSLPEYVCELSDRLRWEIALGSKLGAVFGAPIGAAISIWFTLNTDVGAPTEVFRLVVCCFVIAALCLVLEIILWYL